ncbi:MAG: DUF2330 domain-containing protein [Bacteroidia bacterium]
MRTSLFFLVSFYMCLQQASAFCGFYVAKADASLFNQASQVILVRDGQKLTITMSNDYEGEAKDFAMVVPVPVVLKEDQIKVVEHSIFDVLDAYSAPRLVEYFDNNPCQKYYEEDWGSGDDAEASYDEMPKSSMTQEESKYKVKIEAKYTVGEYDILILSAKESGGLEKWLHANGYQIPKKAKEVLKPYINSEMKFFVVKVNLEEQQKTQSQTLRPLQISFDSPKFMLPIRLGMANAKTFQDLIIYSFTKTGRTECSNYRTIPMPTALQIPMGTKDIFPLFYKTIFDKQYEEAQKAGIFLEYAWNIQSQSFFACDPCVSDPPFYKDLQMAGVNWVTSNQNSEENYGSAADFNGDFFITRMHVRYDRAHFPQDLVFQETPNIENFQVRYILTHDAQGDLDCEAANAYKQELMQRKNKEMDNLFALTNWEQLPINGIPQKVENQEDKNFFVPFLGKNTPPFLPYVVLILSLVALALGAYQWKRINA